MEFSISDDLPFCSQHKGPLLNYSTQQISNEDFVVRPHGLLSETNIRQQETTVFNTNGYKAFFIIDNSAIDFDILSASFYLLSRYEEYLPNEKDMYGRFAHDQSIAYKNEFLHLPLVNIWIDDFARLLQKKFPELSFKRPLFKYLPTYDIDMAWSYQHKGLIRNIGGFFSSPSTERIKVLLGLEKDPFDCYEFLDQLHQQYDFYPVYFYLLAEHTGVYDKNISPYHASMKLFIKKSSEKYMAGIHPSWKSNEDVSILKKEKNLLEDMIQQRIYTSRQHYIKFSMPQTFERLIEAGIKKDYSMGYGSINGFRASVASSFRWYNLEKETETSLRLFPFCFMDANAHYEQHQDTDTSYNEMVHYYQTCKKANGLFITIFHNYILGTEKRFKGWRMLYEKFIAQVQQ